MPENTGNKTELTAWHCYQGHSQAKQYLSLARGKPFPLFQAEAQYKVSESKHTITSQFRGSTPCIEQT